MKVKKLLLVLALTFAVAVMASCGKPNPGTDPVKEAETFTYNSYSSALGNNWNPHTWETNADDLIQSYISSPFVTLSVKNSKTQEYQWIYEMATEVTDVTAAHHADMEKYGSTIPTGKTLEEMDNGFVFDITLNPKAKWENGTPINADTYVESLRRLLDSKMRNYRANLYVDGESAIAGAKGFYNSEVPLYDPIKGTLVNSVEEYFANEDVLVDEETGLVYVMNGAAKVYLFTSIKNALPFFKESMKTYYDAGYVPYFVVPYTGDVSQFGDDLPEWLIAIEPEEEGGETTYKMDFVARYMGSANGFNVIPVDQELFEAVKNLCLNFGDENPTAWNEMMFFHNGYGDKVEFDAVGLYKVDDYKIRYVLQTFQQKDYFLTSLTSTWLVYEELYDAGKKQQNDLTITDYCTTKENTMSYGPYKIESFQPNKQIIFVKNPNWFGYVKQENGELYSETPFLVDGKHVQQFQCTKLVIDVMEDSAAKQVFLSGGLDEWAPTASELSDYTLSPQLYKVDETYTQSFFFNTGLAALQAMDASKGNQNSVVLSNVNFRKAMSLSINRAEWVLTTPGYKPAFALLNRLYYYNVYEDPTSIYRDTDEAKLAIVGLYGIEYGADKLYKTLDEAHDSVTGYNLTEAKALMKTACEELVAANLYVEGQPIKIRIAYKKGALESDDYAQVALIQDYLNAAVEGSGFGAVTLEAIGSVNDRYGDVPAGEFAIGYGAWGGAAFYPFRNFQVYCDSDAYDVNETGCWNPAIETFTMEVNGVEETMTWKDWSNSMVGSGKFTEESFETKLYITSVLEKALLEKYYRIPLAGSTACSMLSYKVSYYTEEYNIMYDFGGFRLMEFNYNDVEWAKFVEEQNHKIQYN